MRKKVSIALSVALYCTFASALCAAQPELATADWSVNAPRSLAKYPPSDDARLALLNKLSSLPGVDAIYFGICSSRFADLRHSGNLSLVVSASDGRHCFPSIIDKTSSGFEVYTSNQDGEIPEIKDLKGNGSYELIVNADLNEDVEHITPCIATWPVIFAWTGNGYTDVSNQYRGYYEKELASLKGQILAAGERNASAVSPSPAFPSSVRQPPPVVVDSELTSGPSGGFGAPAFVPAPEISPSAAASPAATSTPAYVSDCTEAEAAKIERFLGISKDAGISDAIKWADSDNPAMRVFASFALLDIGTPDAIEYLQTLSHDSNDRVARIANRQLGFVGRGSTPLEFKREDVEPLTGSPPK